MGKKAGKDVATGAEQIQQPDAVPAAPAAENTPSSPIAELQEKGIVTLTAQTREQLHEDALALIEAAEGNAYALGAAGFNPENGLFTITIKKKEE